MHDLIISAYEREQQKLITENTDLRNTIRDLQGDLQNLMNNAPKSGTAVGLSNAAPLSQDMLVWLKGCDVCSTRCPYKIIPKLAFYSQPFRPTAFPVCGLV